jgi:hypothetical protein
MADQPDDRCSRHWREMPLLNLVRAVGRIADVAPSVVESCMEGLLHLLYCSTKPEIIGEVVVTLRQILQQNMHSKVSTTIVHQLLKILLTSSSSSSSDSGGDKGEVAMADIQLELNCHLRQSLETINEEFEQQGDHRWWGNDWRNSPIRNDRTESGADLQ